MNGIKRTQNEIFSFLKLNICLVVIFLLVASASLAPACRRNGDKQCKQSAECCSQYCWRPEGWEFGACKLADLQEFVDTIG